MAKPLQIKSFLPQREIDICQRLREIRLSFRWGQPDFAKEVGISRERLASYEYAKAPVRYELGKQVCYRFGINQRWLAEGKEPRKHYMDVSPHLEFGIKVKMLFSEAYDKILKGWIENQLLEIENIIGHEALEGGDFEDAMLDNFPLPGSPTAEGLRFYISHLLQLNLLRMPPDLQSAYAKAILDANGEFCKNHKAVMDRWWKDTYVAESTRALRQKQPPQKKSKKKS